MTGRKGDGRCQGLNRLEVIGNARLFNQTHELLCQFFQAHKYLMLKIKYNAQRCNVQRGDVSRHVLFSYSCMICLRTG